MTDLELQHARHEKWRLDDKPIRTIEDSRRFIERVGICLMYPQRNLAPLPTFIGAFVGSDDHLPDWQHAFSDTRSAQATELMVRLLRERAAYETNRLDENNGLLFAASVFPYFYALVGERNPKLPPSGGKASPYSQLACDAYAVVEREGPVSRHVLMERLAGGLSIAAVDKALSMLSFQLRITRVDYSAGDGASWDVLQRWAPDALREGIQLSLPEALSALVSRYVDCAVAAEPPEIESFFGHFVARSKIKDAVNALISARELSFVAISGRSMLQITPEKVAVVPPPQPVAR